jgi:hypothetical protein
MHHVNSHQLSMLVVSVTAHRRPPSSLLAMFFSFVETVYVNDSCMPRLAKGSCFLFNAAVAFRVGLS